MIFSQRKRFRSLSRSHWPVWILLLGCGACLIGCGSEEGKSSDTPQTPAPVETKPKDVKPKVEKPDPKKLWLAAVEKAQAQLNAGELKEAEATLTELEALYQDPEKPSEEQLTELAALKALLREKRETQIAEKRAADLTEAERLMNVGKFTESNQKLNDVIAASPTPEQRETTRGIQAEITRRRKARRDLLTWVQLLNREDKRGLATAHSNLLRQPEVALGMMIEASEDLEKPILAGNSLEVLRMLNRPKESLPALLAVLKREQQQDLWPIAVRELGRIQSPGAGEPLLELALSTKNDTQRIAALEALSQVVDIPNRTFPAVLPFINANGPELAVAIQTGYQAARLHQQFDLAARRGFDQILTEEQEDQLANLPKRLTELMQRPVKDAKDPNAEVVRSAKALAIATRQVLAEPLKDVKVLRAEAEYPDGPATAVLDGVWDSIDLMTMWRHPVDKRSTITLDLGETKTVAGVRIWNFNQQSGTQRGWKDVEIFVSDSPTALTPSAIGIVPRAAGADKPVDYSSQIPVPFVRGRYVRLRAKSLWSTDTYTGLSEIQVLGF